MRALAANLRWFAPYAASIALTKGMALISIPLVTRYLSPAEYGRLELVLSLVEVAGIVLSFAIADVLFRLTSEGGEQMARKHARDLAGLTLVAAFGVGAFLQMLAFAASGLLGGAVDGKLLALGLLGASVSGLIEMPLAWIRCQGRANLFLAFVGARSIAQIAMMWLTLSNGWGAFGLLAGNALVDITISAILIFRQHRDTGIAIGGGAFPRAAAYGGPLVVGSLAMFVLGACDRWFLAGAAPLEDIAHYALAAKLALAVALAVQPFGLWWYPRRIRVLGEADGARRSADAVVIGFGFLMGGVIVVTCLAPFLFEWLLPASYAPALRLIPALACIAALNEACSLMNVGAYAGRTGTPALAVNAAGAAVALAGYILLVPAMGVQGAIAATIAAHAVRLVAFHALGLRSAPIPYRYAAIACLACVAAAAATMGPELAPAARLCVLAGGLSAVLIVVFVSIRSPLGGAAGDRVQLRGSQP